MFSIIITTFNSEETIISTLNSILNQQYSNFEIIIVDDGSIDNTCSLINEINDFRIKLLIPGKIGRAAALNYGIKNSKFNWIGICDSDDIWHPQKLQLQFNFISITPNCDLLSTNSTLFSKDEDIIFKKLNSSFNFKQITIKDILRKNIISHSSVLIKKDIVLYNEIMKSQIDYELWLRLLSEKKYNFILLLIPLTFHRIHVKQSFESIGFKYKFGSIKLVNLYAIKNNDPISLFLNILKIPYYIFSRFNIIKISKKIVS